MTGPEDNPRDDEPIDREAYENWEQEQEDPIAASNRRVSEYYRKHENEPWEDPERD
jgi:hypothetical protein